MRVKCPDCRQVAEDEERQHHARGTTRAEEPREDQHVQQTETGETGFADADADRRDDRGDPLHVGQVGHMSLADCRDLYRLSTVRQSRGGAKGRCYGDFCRHI